MYQPSASIHPSSKLVFLLILSSTALITTTNPIHPCSLQDPHSPASAFRAVHVHPSIRYIGIFTSFIHSTDHYHHPIHPHSPVSASIHSPSTLYFFTYSFTHSANHHTTICIYPRVYPRLQPLHSPASRPAPPLRVPACVDGHHPSSQLSCSFFLYTHTRNNHLYHQCRVNQPMHITNNAHVDPQPQARASSSMLKYITTAM